MNHLRLKGPCLTKIGFPCQEFQTCSFKKECFCYETNFIQWSSVQDLSNHNFFLKRNLHLSLAKTIEIQSRNFTRSIIVRRWTKFRQKSLNKKIQSIWMTMEDQSFKIILESLEQRILSAALAYRDATIKGDPWTNDFLDGTKNR